MKWTGTKSKEIPQETQPKAKVKISVMAEAMESFGSVLSKKEADNIKASLGKCGLTDTRAQTNSAGILLLEKLNFPVEKLIRGTTDRDLNMVGAILAQQERNGKVGRCIIYICRKEETQIFSQTSFRELGMFSENFVKPSYRHDGRITVCHCPTRTSLPPIFTVMPHRNKGALKAWSKERYVASAFNT